MPYRVFFIDRSSRTNTFNITNEFSGLVTGLYSAGSAQSDIDGLTQSFLGYEETIHIGSELPLDAVVTNDNDFPILIRVKT